MGKAINCSTNRKTTTNVLESIYVMTYRTSQKFNRPIGVHIRVRLTPKMDLRSFSSRLNKNYKKYGYNPIRVTVKEDDPDNDGVHYHAAIVIEGKYNTPLSLNAFFAKLKRNNYLADYSIINEEDHPYGLSLNSECNRDRFFKWLSYLAKTRTKVLEAQYVSKCKAVESDLTLWRESGKPDLRQTKYPPTPRSTNNARQCILTHECNQGIATPTNTAYIDV